MKTTLGVAASMAVVIGVTAGCKVATVRRLDDQGPRRPSTSLGAAPGRVEGPETATGAAPPFDAAAMVSAAWDTEVLPAITRARDVNALAADEAIEQPVVVRARGRVVEANVRSRAGTAIVVVGAARVVVQIGPVLTGTAIRDALPAFGFDRFVNQLQHADIGNELNARVEQQVLQHLDRSKLLGAHLAFAGMARRDERGLLTITPVRLELQERP
jgi:predicted lipoprotein